MTSIDSLEFEKEQKIPVALRIRPPKKQKQSWQHKDYKKAQLGFYKYKLDHIFKYNHNIEHIQDHMIYPLLKKVPQGYNQIIFFYGQTFAGKTHSFQEIAPLIVQYILKTKDQNTKLFISYFEIFKEKNYDLISENKNRVKRHEISQIKINDFDAFIDLFSKAEQKRRIRTEYRPDSIYPEYNSSQSNTILEIFQIHNIIDKGYEQKSRFILLDLVGAEQNENPMHSLHQFVKVFKLLRQSPNEIILNNKSKLTKYLSRYFNKSFMAFLFCIQQEKIINEEIDKILNFSQNVSFIQRFVSSNKKKYNKQEQNLFLQVDNNIQEQQQDVLKKMKMELFSKQQRSRQKQQIASRRVKILETLKEENGEYKMLFDYLDDESYDQLNNVSFQKYKEEHCNLERYRRNPLSIIGNNVNFRDIVQCFFPLLGFKISNLIIFIYDNKSFIFIHQNERKVEISNLALMQLKDFLIIDQQMAKSNIMEIAQNKKLKLIFPVLKLPDELTKDILFKNQGVKQKIIEYHFKYQDQQQIFRTIDRVAEFDMLQLGQKKSYEMITCLEQSELLVLFFLDGGEQEFLDNLYFSLIHDGEKQYRFLNNILKLEEIKKYYGLKYNNSKFITFGKDQLIYQDSKQFLKDSKVKKVQFVEIYPEGDQLINL